jgi:hypothetical protein
MGNYKNIYKIYGISQNPDTKDYILVLQDEFCKCSEKYTYIECRWCEPCNIKYLKENFRNWTSGNEKIDNYIQEMQLKKLKINHPYDIMFEWVSYNQFSNIKEINNTTFSALWKDGPLRYDNNKQEYIRVQAKEVTLKICNSQSTIDEFLNKV